VGSNEFIEKVRAEFREYFAYSLSHGGVWDMRYSLVMQLYFTLWMTFIAGYLWKFFKLSEFLSSLIGCQTLITYNVLRLSVGLWTFLQTGSQMCNSFTVDNTTFLPNGCNLVQIAAKHMLTRPHLWSWFLNFFLQSLVLIPL
jgi:hypothetical protein